MKELKTIYNGESFATGELEATDISSFRAEVISAVKSGGRIASLFGMPQDNGTVRLVCVIASDGDGTLNLAAADVNDSYEAITKDCTQAHWFEREIAEQYAIKPEGHGWLKPIRFHKPYRGQKSIWHNGDEKIEPCVTEFFKVRGQEVHEVAVGPVHAGIIEPGHFRFQCHGEDVFHLEISLGYQHRGIEKALKGGPDTRTIHYMETAAGDTTIGHASAYCQLLESLCGCHVPARAQVIRGIALELERLANHTGDLGALAGDVGYLPTASFCGRIRGDFLNMTALLCGNRFGRGIVRPGGTGINITKEIADELKKRLKMAYKDVSIAANLLWETSSVLNRFEETGTLSQETARELGLVGVAARACGMDIDTRYNFANGIYQFCQVPVATWHSGDVFARAYVRWLEIQQSVEFIETQLENMPDGSVLVPAGRIGAGKMGVSMVEGWRGEICHTAVTDASGRIRHYKIVDPSLHNWMGLAVALRGQQISDFPLCNKSFNLSYCGHDL